MIYILIFVFKAYVGSAPSAAISVEFKTKEACSAAAAEIRRQIALNTGTAPVLFCVAKGIQ